MKGVRSWLITAALLAVSCGPVLAQVTERGECPEWARVRVLPDQPTPVHQCNLEAPPALRSSLDLVPTKMYGSLARADMTVVVDPEGRVDPELTRLWSLGGDLWFARQVAEAMRALEYEPRALEGEAVRYAVELYISTEARSWEGPALLTWRYVPGVMGDSLLGTWEETVPEPPLEGERVAELAGEVTRVLREMRVLTPEHGEPTCLLFGGPHEELVRSALAREFHRTGSDGCAEDVGQRRYRIEEPVAIGGGWTLVETSGDYLESWPPGLDGRSARSWTARCVVPGTPEEAEGTRCEVTPNWLLRRSIWGRTHDAFGEPIHRDAPVKFLVEVTTDGAFRTDTILAELPEVPRLEERALFVPDGRQCTTGASWSMRADSVTGDEFVIWIRIPAGSTNRPQVRMTEVRPMEPEAAFRGRECPETFEGPMAYLTLGGVGEPLLGPVRICLNEPGCTQRFVLDPEVHEFAVEPHMRFRLGDLRESALEGRWLRLRLQMDRTIHGLVPVVLMRTPDGIMPLGLGHPRERRFNFVVGDWPPGAIAPETEFWIYLTRAGSGEG